MADKKLASHVWFNGRLVPQAEATVSVMAHALHYGSAVFEGIRAYETPHGPAIFQLDAHIKRLLFSARVYRMEVPFSAAQLEAACCEVVRHAGLRSAYIRPLVFRGAGSLGVVPKDSPIEVMVAAMQWGAYLGETALQQGISACVSSWSRLAPNTMPTMAKAAGNYLSSQLIAMEAKRNGYDEAIALDVQGFVSEGPGENLFMICDGIAYTPPLSASILPGVTRNTIIELCGRAGIEVRQQNLSREALYMADELFFCGTAAEVTPIATVDGLTVGEGGRGPLTKRLQELFFGLFSGQTPDQHGWLKHLS
ncbi:MAG: branched-chain amino acid transaminase [Deltaproteobacteria bacterium]|nr:MAG: branched-chain amino acid transaminase [Deltaproteobacteria bacterium]